MYQYLRLCYRFLGEVVDLDSILEAGKKAGKVRRILNPPTPNPSLPFSGRRSGEGGEKNGKIERPADVKIGEDGEGKGVARI